MDPPKDLIHRHIANYDNAPILSPVFKKCNYDYNILTDRDQKVGAAIDNH